VFTWASIIVNDTQLLRIERKAQQIIEDLVPTRLREDFEFHACELFQGNGVWSRWRNQAGKSLRFEILKRFLGLIRRHRLPIAECSWPKHGERDGAAIKLRQGVAFSVCVDSVEHWLSDNAKHDCGLLVADDQGDRKDEAVFKKQIRRARKVSLLLATRRSALRHIVDTIYFASSHQAIGLQLADACAFFVKRHRMAQPADEAEKFYKLIRPYIYHSKSV